MWQETAHQLEGWGWHLSMFPGGLAPTLLGTCMVLADLENSCALLQLGKRWGHQLYPLNSGVSEASVRATKHILGVGCGAKDKVARRSVRGLSPGEALAGQAVVGAQP